MSDPAAHGDVRARRRWFAVAALVSGAVVVPFAALESGLRAYHRHRGTYEVGELALLGRRILPYEKTWDPDLVYVNRPGYADGGELQTESHGILRPTEVTTTKPRGTIRIAVVGDSVGAGNQVRYAERFATLIERRLCAELARPVEVLNFCVDGYDTVNEARILESAVPTFDVDAVLLVYCLNDPSENQTPLSAFRDPTPPTSFAVDFLRRTALTALGRPPGLVVTPELGPDGPAKSAWDRMYEPTGEGWRRVERGLDRVAAWSRARRTPILVAVAPLLLADDPKGTTTAAYRAQVIDALKSRDLSAVDLQDACSQWPASQFRARPDDIYHFSPFGHRVATDALLPAARRLLGK